MGKTLAAYLFGGFQASAIWATIIFWSQIAAGITVYPIILIALILSCIGFVIIIATWISENWNKN